MGSRQSIWFRLGHALERARRIRPAPAKVVGLAERRKGGAPTQRERPSAALPAADELIDAAIVVAVDGLLGAWSSRRRPGFGGLAKAGAAGAGAALIVDLVRPLLRGDARLPVIDQHTADRVIAGIGQGLVYGAVVEPRVPGPTLLKGALYGSVEYATDPVGGLSHLLGSHTPQARLPVVSELLTGGAAAHDRAYLEHVVFGIALALLYGSRRSSNGMTPVDQD
jgi:hypothetical protein